jgi:hypothetical protein
LFVAGAINEFTGNTEEDSLGRPTISSPWAWRGLDMRCRHCNADVTQRLADLGAAPPSNSYIDADKLTDIEVYYPLRVMVCTNCWLVQTEDFAQADKLFSKDYAYFSSVSQSWLEHSARYASRIIERLALTRASMVIEVAANDGYLLKHFVAAGIPCVGIEPTDSTAAAAERSGIPIIREFFGELVGKRLAQEGRKADLIIGNNVYAHVPDINDFTLGLKAALKDVGTITLEFPHLVQLIKQTQFDTMYHEHFSYLLLTSISRVFASAELRIYDVEELPTHGGSLRVFGCHVAANLPTSPSVAKLLSFETQNGFTDVAVYQNFQQHADRVKNDLTAFLIDMKRQAKVVVGYGAAAKGNTLLNYAGIKPDLLPFVCDAAPSKQGKYLPGSRIPIRHPDALREHRPDYVLVFPWNIVDEVTSQHGYIREWGGRFVVAVPNLREIA